MADLHTLANHLRRIDGRGYKAYKDIAGGYHTAGLSLFVDHVQGDPFAAPSRVRVRIPMSAAGIPPHHHATKIRRTALEDFLLRQVHHAILRIAEGHRGSGKSGLVTVDVGGPEVLERTGVLVQRDWVEVRLQAGLPAAGRRVLGRQAEDMLCREIPEIATRGLCWHHLNATEARSFVDCCENQAFIRERLGSRNLVAFIADGAILPRESGASSRPMLNAVPFRSPESLRVSFDLPNPWQGASRIITGMGIPRGVTLIVGGGYHGKSTVLQALQHGVYTHVPGDGREYVVTDPAAVKIRAEDGRSVAGVDIHAFISGLPNGMDTARFTTGDASGSTSQAANIAEAVEAGATTLLVDEDTSATNFMMRDARMQALIEKSSEPITPFIDCVRDLYLRHDVSTVLVLGGCGDYIDVADLVIMMKTYVPFDVTREAREVARRIPSLRTPETPPSTEWIHPRVPLRTTLDPSRGRREVKIDARGRHHILFGTEDIDLQSVEQIVDPSQTRAIGFALNLARSRYMQDDPSVPELLDRLDTHFETRGLDELAPHLRPESHPGNFARPRRFEIAAALNRVRGIKVSL